MRHVGHGSRQLGLHRNQRSASIKDRPVRRFVADSGCLPSRGEFQRCAGNDLCRQSTVWVRHLGRLAPRCHSSEPTGDLTNVSICSIRRATNSERCLHCDSSIFATPPPAAIRIPRPARTNKLVRSRLLGARTGHAPTPAERVRRKWAHPGSEKRLARAGLGFARDLLRPRCGGDKRLPVRQKCYYCESY